MADVISSNEHISRTLEKQGAYNCRPGCDRVQGWKGPGRPGGAIPRGDPARFSALVLLSKSIFFLPPPHNDLFSRVRDGRFPPKIGLDLGTRMTRWVPGGWPLHNPSPPRPFFRGSDS